MQFVVKLKFNGNVVLPTFFVVVMLHNKKAGQQQQQHVGTLRSLVMTMYLVRDWATNRGLAFGQNGWSFLCRTPSMGPFSWTDLVFFMERGGCGFIIVQAENQAAGQAASAKRFKKLQGRKIKFTYYETKWRSLSLQTNNKTLTDNHKKQVTRDFQKVFRAPSKRPKRRRGTRSTQEQ